VSLLKGKGLDVELTDVCMLPSKQWN